MNFLSKTWKISDFSGWCRASQATFSVVDPTKNKAVVKANRTKENKKVK